MSCPAVEILMEIRDRLRNLDTLEERREKNRLQMAAKRAAAKVVYTQESVYTQKEDEKGKEEKSPRTPLKGVKGKDEETKKYSRAHARFVPPTLDEVTAYCRERHNSVDPVLWWNFYAAKGWLIGKAKMIKHR